METGSGGKRLKKRWSYQELTELPRPSAQRDEYTYHRDPRTITGPSAFTPDELLGIWQGRFADSLVEHGYSAE